MKHLQQETQAEAVRTRHRTPRRTGIDHFGIAAMILMLAVSLVLYFRVVSSRFLTSKYLLLIMVVLIVVNAIHVFVQLPLRRNKLGKLICGAVSLVLTAVMIWSMISVGSLQSALARITGKVVESDVIVVAVQVNDPAQELSDTAGYTYGYTDSVDKENSVAMLEHLHDKLGEFPTQISDSTVGVIQSLLQGNVQAIFINNGFLEILKEQEDYSDISSRIRVIYEYTITREIDVPASNIKITEPFIIYCNGIDARSSDITARANSDVNILAVVNPSSHEILLLNTPRDYYVALHMNGEKDKLTHAGAYSIEESMNTLADLYNVSIPYYVRINFYGLVGIVDALGGVDVESPQAFTTNTMEIPTADGNSLEQRSYSFPAGPVHLTGREALAFARERYAFADGDNQRGKNQMTVIRGIVDKITSPAILSNYQDLLKAFSDCFVTNISYNDVTALVKAQQKNMQGWHVTTYAVSGYPDSSICYSYPKYPLYVTRPDYDSVETAKTLIGQVMSGEVPTLPEN